MAAPLRITPVYAGAGAALFTGLGVAAATVKKLTSGGLSSMQGGHSPPPTAVEFRQAGAGSWWYRRLALHQPRASCSSPRRSGAPLARATPVFSAALLSSHCRDIAAALPPVRRR